MLRVVYFPVKHSCLYNKRQYLIFIFLSFSGSTREEFGRGIPLWARLDFPGGTPYNCLYGEAPPERGAFFTRQVYKRVGISLVSSQAIKRVGPRGGASQYKTLLSPRAQLPAAVWEMWERQKWSLTLVKILEGLAMEWFPFVLKGQYLMKNLFEDFERLE